MKSCNIIFFSVFLPKQLRNSLPYYGIQGQLFLGRLIEGVRKNSTDKIYSISFIKNDRYIQKEMMIDGINYFIIFFRSAIRIITFVLSFLKKYSIKNDETTIIVDGLNFKCLLSAIILRLFFRIKSITVVTDVPRFIASNNIKGRFYSYIIESMIRRTDGYVFLTQEMNNLLNKKNKPYCIIEGFVNPEIINTNSNHSCNNKIIMYAGGVSKLYGVDKLVDACISLKEIDFELHIYGRGNYVDELKKISILEPKIKYMGEVSNEQIIELERSAYLLVNPRPINDLYTIYSFPSKTIEYMASGTPFLTTKLRCIPEEYNQYLNFIDGDDIYNSLKEIFEIPYDVLRNKAESARDFIAKNKTNNILCGRIIKIIQEL